MANVNVPLDPDLHRRLRTAAADQDMKIQQAVTQAIEEWVAKRETARREQERSLWTGLQHPPEGQS